MSANDSELPLAKVGHRQTPNTTNPASQYSRGFVRLLIQKIQQLQNLSLRRTVYGLSVVLYVRRFQLICMI